MELDEPLCDYVTVGSELSDTSNATKYIHRDAIGKPPNPLISMDFSLLCSGTFTWDEYIIPGSYASTACEPSTVSSKSDWVVVEQGACRGLHRLKVWPKVLQWLVIRLELGRFQTQLGLELGRFQTHLQHAGQLALRSNWSTR